MLERSVVEQLVFNDPSARVANEGVDVDLWGGLAGGKQLRPRVEVCPAEQIPAFPVQFIRPRLSNCVENGTDGIAELRSESVVLLDHFLHVGIGDRNQPDTRAIALRIAAAIDLIVDSA